MLLVALGLVLSACGVAGEGDPIFRKRAARQAGFGRSAIVPDRMATAQLGERACAHVFTPASANLYKISAAERPKRGEASIAGYKVEAQLGEVAADYLSPLQFLLSDSLSYNDSPLVPAVPFMPNVAIGFATSRRDTVYLLFSFASEQIGIVEDGRMVKILRYRNPRLIMLYFQRMLGVEHYSQQLNSKQ